jgi:hypothetical protein
MYYLGIHQYIINIDDHECIQLFMESRVMKVVNVNEALYNPNGITRNS